MHDWGHAYASRRMDIHIYFDTRTNPFRHTHIYSKIGRQ